jgi:hypothetical protein
MVKWNAGLHLLVVICSLANLLLKLIILGVLATVKGEDLKNGFRQFRGVGAN